jgi:hypothetical protein
MPGSTHRVAVFHPHDLGARSVLRRLYRQVTGLEFPWASR